jgi:hypothetical protein
MSWSALRRRTRRPTTTIVAIAALCALAVPAAQAAPPPTPTTTAAFSGGSGTATVGGTLFARAGAPVTLTVTAPDDTKCVDVAGAFSGHQISDTARSTWTFAFTGEAGDGLRTVSVSATGSFNKNNGGCTSGATVGSASFTADNTGPVVSGSLSPAPNAAGWNKSNVQVAWSATDAGSGVASGPTPTSDSQNASTAGITKTATATDRVGNVGTGSTTVKLDKDAPTITATRSPAANADGWNNGDVTVSLRCADALSGVKSCTGGGTVVLSTEGANQSVSGQAVDDADNTASTTVSGINIDTTAPTLTGAPTTAAVNGWYSGDVTIRWTASDALSGLAGTAPADSTITGEGAGLTASATVSDTAGNSTTSTSPSISIDRTAPVTHVTGASNAWTNGAVTLGLSPSDGLSGVASTTYAVDDGPAQDGDRLTLSDEGDHTITFFSTDVAGNVEAAQTVHVKIDKTAPSIGHSFAPDGYTDGAWTNTDVTVTFDCADTGGSGVAHCSSPVTMSDEGEHQVVGTAADGAGNTATDTATVNIDTTKPTITGSTTATANAEGWYRTEVPVAFACADALSGIGSCGPATVLTKDGGSESALGEAVDNAGNTQSATFGPVKIDRTAPQLHADVTPGWHTGDVTVDWSCTDQLSGPAAQPDDETLTGEGDNLSSSATCSDLAGNTTALTIGGIKIDRHAPATSASVPHPLASGWYGGPVRVTLTASDGLSGVATTRYSVDGGGAQLYDGGFDFATKGIHTLTYWSVDNAGNEEDHSTSHTLTLKIDDVAPTTTVINPISPASGWFVVSGIPVAFDAVDAESGIHATYYRIDGGDALVYGEAFTEPLADGSHSIEYWSIDNAGNAEEHHTTTVSVDTTAPSISAAVTSGTLGANGWYTTPVTVRFTCSDDGSGTAEGACPADETVSTDGAAQVVTGSVTDRAGNEASTSVTINLDQTGPTVTGANVDGKRYTLGETVPAPTCTATDLGSGPASCVVTVTGGNANGVGTFTWTATAKDRAGNATTSTGSYKVVYRFDGFAQPINDTAHQVGLNTSVFKAGSTVPAKLQVKRSDGTVVQPVTAPVWLAPVRGSATSAPIDESLYSATADSGSVYKYDATAQQWSYNWKSLTAGYYWRIGVRLDDGETYYVNLGLR